jgi:hypothetical protein
VFLLEGEKRYSLEGPEVLEPALIYLNEFPNTINKQT